MPAPSGKTTKNSFPYPLETDGADPARDLKALAEALDAVINTAAIMPIGAEAEYAGENDPSTTWMVEDGRAISRTTYAALFGIIATKYGAGDGSTTFNLPDTRGRISVGAGTGTGLTARALATITGKEKVKLAVAEIPSHNHGGVVSTAGTHVHQVYPYFTGGANNGAPGHADPYPGLNSWGIEANILFVASPGNKNWQGFVNQLGNTDATGAHNHTVSAEGGGTEHENMPPVIVKNKIIRVL